jgi:hypothetical protein
MQWPAFFARADAAMLCRIDVEFVAAAIFSFVITILCLTMVAFAADGADAFDLGNTDVTILNPDTRQVLGHSHYKVTRQGSEMQFAGENRFLDGEYDHEVQRVDLATGSAPPILVDYQHSFFNADGSPESIDALDAKTGTLACTHFDGAKTPDVRRSEVTIPRDTYVGSSQLMLLVGRLREGAQTISMHTFICLPGPHIIPMKITPPEDKVKWAMYPGNLMKVEMVPDFGWLGALAGPFVPKSYGWFDPAANFNYVGGLFDRFYTHHHLMMVRTSPDFRTR